MRFPRLFSRARPEPEPAAKRAPTPPATTRFAVDRPRMFDLALTARLIALCAVDRDERDDAWSEAFFDAIWNAAMQVPTPQVFEGPDGFSYLRLNLPVPGRQFGADCLSAMALTCLEAATGVAVFAGPDATEPAFVMSMGLLDCMRRLDSWRGDPIDLAELAAARPSSNVTVRSESRRPRGPGRHRRPRSAVGCAIGRVPAAHHGAGAAPSPDGGLADGRPARQPDGEPRGDAIPQPHGQPQHAPARRPRRPLPRIAMVPAAGTHRAATSGQRGRGSNDQVGGAVRGVSPTRASDLTGATPLALRTSRGNLPRKWQGGDRRRPFVDCLPFSIKLRRCLNN